LGHGPATQTAGKFTRISWIQKKKTNLCLSVKIRVPLLCGLCVRAFQGRRTRRIYFDRIRRIVRITVLQNVKIKHPVHPVDPV